MGTQSTEIDEVKKLLKRVKQAKSGKDALAAATELEKKVAQFAPKE